MIDCGMLGMVVCLLIATGMDGRRRAGAGGQNCDGALLMARPLSGHAHPVRRQQAPPQATVDRSVPRHSRQLHCGSDHGPEWHPAILTLRSRPGAVHADPNALRRRASSPCTKRGIKIPQAPWNTTINWTSEGFSHGFRVSGWGRADRSLNAIVPDQVGSWWPVVEYRPGEGDVVLGRV
jgi:hypothetical protein